MAAELTENWHVFQWRISTRNVDLILTKLENDLDIGQFDSTVKFHEDISPLKMKLRSFILLFFMAAELTEIWHVFQWRISIRNIDLIITKLENDLDIGQFNFPVKFYQDILPFRMKTRSFNFAIFFIVAKLTENWHVFQ